MGEEKKQREALYDGKRVGFDGGTPIRRLSIYPLVCLNGANSFNVVTAAMADPSDPTKVAANDCPNCQEEIEILQSMVSGYSLLPYS